MLRAPFFGPADYAPSASYRLLPMRFDVLDGERYLVTNDVGEYLCLARRDLEALVEHRLDVGGDAYRALKARHFLFDGNESTALELLALKLRSRTEVIAASTGLHLFVVTLRCDHACPYCQVSRRSEDEGDFDMSEAHAERAIDLVFRSPNPTLKIEFQGGEPLLAFPRVRAIVESIEARNREARRDIQYVIATNLSRLDDEVLAFCKKYRVFLSTSLDGPADLHDAQRPVKGRSSHAMTVASIARARAALGHDCVAALMTTTPASLGRVEEIVDSYAALGFSSIFLRSLSPYGFATKSLIRRYNVDDWTAFYKRGLARVLHHNKAGHRMREDYATVLLQKIFSPLGSSYVDLQSPAGLGIGALVYNYDGAIYASDEGRMLAEMGDTAFRLGHLDDSRYADVMGAEVLGSALAESLLESAPGCSDCAFLPYCGADPTYHRATQGDFLGHKAFSDFCARQMAVLRHLFMLLETEPEARDILLEWV